MIDRCYIEITNVCNLSCDFCPKHNRAERRMTAQEFDLITDKLRDRAVFLYFHLMGEPMLHPLLPDFIRMAREKGFKTVLTSNGTLPLRAMRLLSSLPHKVQLSLHSHESNGKGILAEYIDKVMQFAIPAAEQGTCIVLRLWNQGGRESENEQVIQLLEKYVQKPWHERPDGYRLCDNLLREQNRIYFNANSMKLRLRHLRCLALQKIFTMARKFDSENYKIKFWGINFLAILDNFCSENSSLLLIQQCFYSSYSR